MFNTAHMHLILNHIPVIGNGLALLLLFYALIRKESGIFKSCFILFILSALAAIPTYLTGGRAEEFVEHLPGVRESFIAHHEDLALIALIATEILGLISIAGLYFLHRALSIPKTLTMIILAAAVVTSGLMAWTATLGGQIRHTEIRADQHPRNPSPPEADTHLPLT